VYQWLNWVTPNQLTLGRIASIPVLLLLMYWSLPLTNLIALVLFVLACMTDYWDGNLARSRKEITQLGKLLDPIADKMLITATLVMLVSMGKAGVVPTIFILLREFAVTGLRQVAAAEGVVISAVRGAKWKTIFQMIAVGFLILHNDPFGIPFETMGRVLLWWALVWTLVTGYGYFADYYRKLFLTTGSAATQTEPPPPDQSDMPSEAPSPPPPGERPDERSGA